MPLYTHIHTQIYIYTHTHTYIHRCSAGVISLELASQLLHINPGTNALIVSTDTHTHAHIYIYTYTHIYIHIHTQIYVYTHTHTYIHRCSAGVISLELASQLLHSNPGTNALIVSTEILSKQLYDGNEKGMLLQNTLFRCGGAAVLLTNKYNYPFKKVSIQPLNIKNFISTLTLTIRIYM